MFNLMESDVESVAIRPTKFEMMNMNIRVNSSGITSSYSGSISGKLYVILKRTFDVLFSLVGLILVAPLLALIAVLIRLDSPGPAIFQQLRVGQDRRKRKICYYGADRRKNDLRGRLFYIYKFRTMYVNDSVNYKKPNDSTDGRITRVGGVLRRTCLDELPQLYNVLRGDMSLVGPRPELLHIARNYGRVEKQRLVVKPGLTGLWQLFGDRKLPIHKNLNYDLEYMKNRSFRLDLSILFKTALFAFKQANI